MPASRNSPPARQREASQKNYLFLLEEKLARAKLKNVMANFLRGRPPLCGGWRRGQCRFRFLDLCIKFGKMISKVCCCFYREPLDTKRTSDFQKSRIFVFWGRLFRPAPFLRGEALLLAKILRILARKQGNFNAFGRIKDFFQEIFLPKDFFQFLLSF